MKSNLLIILAFAAPVALAATQCGGITEGSCPSGQICREQPCPEGTQCFTVNFACEPEETSETSPSSLTADDKCQGKCTADEKCAYGSINHCIPNQVCSMFARLGWRCEKKAEDQCGGCPANQKCEQRKYPCGPACTALKFMCVDPTPPPATQCSSYRFGECPSGQTCKRKACPPGLSCTLSYKCVPSTTNYGKCGYMNQKGTCPSGQECTAIKSSCFMGQCNKKWKCKKVGTATVKPTPTPTPGTDKCQGKCSADEKCAYGLIDHCIPNQACSQVAYFGWRCEKKAEDECGGCPNGYHCTRTGNGQGLTCWPNGAPPAP